jgi:monoamine oxidase
LEDRYHFSLVEWYLHHQADLFDDLEYIVDGADRLITSFEPLLGDVLHLGCAVEGVDPTGDGVLVHYRSAFTRQALEADACILTLPFCLMRTMEIGGMDPAKSYAIRNCYYGRAHKIFMQFRWRWWESLDGISHGTTTTDRGSARSSTRRLVRIARVVAACCWCPTPGKVTAPPSPPSAKSSGWPRP